MYKIWWSKKISGFCRMWVKVGLYSGHKYPNKRCPNCGTKVTDAHLMRCPVKDKRCLVIDNVEELSKWMEQTGNSCTGFWNIYLCRTTNHFS
jgi:endogenous inhibitor of DNA gyrase (YacG/DUF329 family)